LTFRRSSADPLDVSSARTGARRCGIRSARRSPTQRVVGRTGVDFATNTIAYPPSISDMRAARSQPSSGDRQTDPRMRATGANAGAIAARYAQPERRSSSCEFRASGPSRGIANAHWFAARNRSARSRALIDATPYLALEASTLCRRGPSQAAGACASARLLGADVARLLADAPPSASATAACGTTGRPPPRNPGAAAVCSTSIIRSRGLRPPVNRHSARSSLRVLALFRDRRRVFLFAPRARAHRLLIVKLLFLRPLERLVTFFFSMT